MRVEITGYEIIKNISITLLYEDVSEENLLRINRFSPGENPERRMVYLHNRPNDLVALKNFIKNFAEKNKIELITWGDALQCLIGRTFETNKYGKLS